MIMHLFLCLYLNLYLYRIFWTGWMASCVGLPVTPVVHLSVTLHSTQQGTSPPHLLTFSLTLLYATNYSMPHPRRNNNITQIVRNIINLSSTLLYVSHLDNYQTNLPFSHNLCALRNHIFLFSHTLHLELPWRRNITDLIYDLIHVTQTFSASHLYTFSQPIIFCLLCHNSKSLSSIYWSLVLKSEKQGSSANSPILGEVKYLQSKIFQSLINILIF